MSRLLLLFIGIFSVRLIQLQVLDKEYYRALADENRIKMERLPADRGGFLDRFGEPISVNETNAVVLGYSAEADEAEAQEFYLGAKVGKMGLEKQYDSQLRGVDGVSILEQESDGQILRELKRTEPIKGRDLKLSLDSGLQKKAYELLGGKKGALVAAVPETGEILALVSSPGFSPENLTKYLNDPNLPLFNRALGGEYPPGSTFKIITATAALEESKIEAATLIEDTGEIKIGPYRFGNWYFDQYGKTEGQLNLVRALARSNDVFFYRLGEKLGIGLLADWAKYFGLGYSSGIDLPGEAPGLMPDEQWKLVVIKDNWYLGDTFISAIGQGNILTTPLQVNQMTAIIANRGRLCQPYLIGNKNCKRLDINQKTLDLIIEGLKQVCEPGGTAWPFFEFQVKGEPVSVAGKTGTAEFGPAAEEKTHAWFTGFTPIEKPQIVLTVLLEGAGEGSYQAAPVAKDLLQYWYERQ